MALGLRPLEIVGKGTYPLLVKADHWERVTLSDVANVQNGFAFKSSYFGPDRGVPLIRIRDISKEETEHRYWGEFDDQYLVKTDEILIGMDGDFAASRWTGEKALLNQRVCKVTLTSDLFDEGFLYLCLQPFLNAINAETSSVTVKHLSSKTIEEIPLPLPPLMEQRHIVAKIEELFSELDKGIESLKAARAKLNIYRQAVLKHAFEGKLTAQWREENKDKLETPEQLLARIKQEREARYEQQFKEWKAAVKTLGAKCKSSRKPTAPKRPTKVVSIKGELREELPAIPACWEWLNLKHVGRIETGTTPPTKIPENYGGKLPFFKPTDLDQGAYVRTARNYLSPLGEECARVLPAGSTLVTCIGATIGKTGFAVTRCATNQQINSVSPCAVFDPKFVYLQMVAPFLNERVRADASATTLPILNKSKFSELPFVLFSLPEQHELVRLVEERFVATERSEREIDSALNLAEMLRQSILKNAFSGQLIPQDPDDEPASSLLERIKAEKAARSQNNTRAKRRRTTATA